jgi:16S rRNA (guanine527-N7)-methyltransferase
LDEGQLLSLEKLAALLLDWNQKINLISRRDEENVWTNHVLHCLALLFRVDLPRCASILDLGTGGGLPGIPIKIARPDLSLTLLDSTQKKINVVKNLIEELGLKGIEAVWGRAEELGKLNQHTRRYDIVVARAVASLKDLVQWSEPFLRTNKNETVAIQTGQAKTQISGPTLIALKGGDLEGEVGQIRKLSQVKTITVLDLTLKGSNQLEGGEKKIVLVEFAWTPKQKAEKH